MIEQDFRTLRDRLESQATPPDFEVISVRRHHRTRRWATLGAAGLTVAVLAGAAWGLRGTTATPPPLAPSAAPSTVSSVTADASGTLFVLDPVSEMVRYSTDRGITWKRLMGEITGRGALAAANANSTWMVTGSEVWYISDGNFTTTPVTDPGAFSVAKERLWLISEGQIQVWTAIVGPVEASPLSAPVIKVAALSAEAAMVMTLTDDDQAQWYYTFDAGAHWTPREDPCHASQMSSNQLASNRHTTMASAPDRSLWAVCAAEPGAGSQPKEALLSTDDGATWKSLGFLESSGYGTAVYPTSKSQAWRAGARADLSRTADGTHWERVAVNENGGESRVAALDHETAVRLDLSGDDGFSAFVTRDGGLTWHAIRF